MYFYNRAIGVYSSSSSASNEPHSISGALYKSYSNALESTRSRYVNIGQFWWPHLVV